MQTVNGEAGLLEIQRLIKNGDPTVSPVELFNVFAAMLTPAECQHHWSPETSGLGMQLCLNPGCDAKRKKPIGADEFLYKPEKDLTRNPGNYDYESSYPDLKPGYVPTEEGCICGFTKAYIDCPIHGKDAGNPGKNSTEITGNAGKSKETLEQKFNRQYPDFEWEFKKYVRTPQTPSVSKSQMIKLFVEIAAQHYAPLMAKAHCDGVSKGFELGRCVEREELKKKFEAGILEWDIDKNKCERGWLGDHLRDRTFSNDK